MDCSNFFSSHSEIFIAKLGKDTLNGRLDSEDGLATELTKEDTSDDLSICTITEQARRNGRDYRDESR